MNDPIPAALSGEDSIRTLRVYLIYRVVIAALLLGLFSAGATAPPLGQGEPKLFVITVSAYLAVSILSLLVCHHRHYRPATSLLFFILLSDIVALSLMMNSSGGLNSGLGYLLLITVAAGSYFFRGQLAILTAAIASICLILESSLAALFALHDGNNVFAAGLLGILLFATALLIQRLNKARVTAQARAASEAEQSAQLLRLNELIVSNMLTGIIVLDRNDRIELINNAALQLLGGNGGNATFVRGDDLRNEPELLAQLAAWRRNHWLRPQPFSPAYSNFEVLANFKLIEPSSKGRTIVFLEDFRSASHQAQQLKLASLGRLTGSIAHEIRNPLGAISHAAELLREQQSQGEHAERLTAIIEKQSRRINHIVENVLQLSRKQNHNFQRLELNSRVTDFVQDYLAATADPPLIEFDVRANPIEVTFDPVHLEQVLTNLLDNAIRYSREATGKGWACIRLGISSSDQVPWLDIIDRGPGVSPDIRNKLFEPFFTTSREGSGLGLYIARELCQVNYATLLYRDPHRDEPGFFRIGFAPPGKVTH